MSPPRDGRKNPPTREVGNRAKGLQVPLWAPGYSFLVANTTLNLMVISLLWTPKYSTASMDGLYPKGALVTRAMEGMTAWIDWIVRLIAMGMGSAVHLVATAQVVFLEIPVHARYIARIDVLRMASV